uniref:Uncharacterized protein n=1 Tax=Strongyloides papillosus TaxID=174720 RepID=A0A0N5C8I3_STREA
MIKKIYISIYIFDDDFNKLTTKKMGISGPRFDEKAEIESIELIKAETLMRKFNKIPGIFF